MSKLQKEGKENTMEDFIIVVILLVLVGAAIFCIRREKKKGAKCIGCPSAGNCCSCQGNVKGKKEKN